MKFLIENELEKRHRKHKKTIKPGAMGSFIHPDGGNQIAIDTFNNSVDMGNVSSAGGLGEALNEDYVEDKLKRLISVQHFISPKDDIQLFTTEKGNYLVKRNGKQMMILGKKNFRESEIEALRLNGYFRDYDKARIGEALTEDTRKQAGRVVNKSGDENNKYRLVKKYKGVSIVSTGAPFNSPFTNYIFVYKGKPFGLGANTIEEAEKEIDNFEREKRYMFKESLTEDTIKQNGKWVNKGKEGTHGKFNTKKQADAQRKAMFANGYHEDWNIIDQIDAPETIGKLNRGDKFKNRNGVLITIIEPMKDGTIQYKIQSKNYPYEVRCGKEKSIQQMLYRNNYTRIEDWK